MKLKLDENLPESLLLVLVRLRLPGRTALLRRLREVFATEPVETWQRGFVLVTDLKVRVLRPGK